MTTNKKKSSSNTKRKEQTQPTISEPNATKSVAGPSEGPVEYTRAQLTSVIFLAVGATRFMEWRNAFYQMLDSPVENVSNETSSASSCEKYLLTDDQVDYDSVCHNPVTTTMMQLKYDLSIQMMLLVTFLTIQCWKNDAMLNRLNAFLTITPISTTLLLLQSINSFLTTRRSLLQTCTCCILMFLAFPATSAVLREARSGNHNYKVESGGWIISLALMSLIGMQLMEMFQWYQTTTGSGSPILAASSLIDWNDAWAVFMNTLMFDRFTMAALLTCVWTCFDEGRQRRFLLVWAIFQFYEYSMSMNAYSASDFEDLEWKKNMVLAGSVVSGIAWFLPNIALPGSTGPKMKTV